MRLKSFLLNYIEYFKRVYETNKTIRKNKKNMKGKIVSDDKRLALSKNLCLISLVTKNFTSDHLDKYIDYYRSIGVEEILFICTIDVDIHHIHHSLSDNNIQYVVISDIKHKENAINYYLSKLCHNKWCILQKELDLFVYPYCNSHSVLTLISYLNYISEEMVLASEVSVGKLKNAFDKDKKNNLDDSEQLSSHKLSKYIKIAKSNNPVAFKSDCYSKANKEFLVAMVKWNKGYRLGNKCSQLLPPGGKESISDMTLLGANLDGNILNEDVDIKHVCNFLLESSIMHDRSWFNNF